MKRTYLLVGGLLLALLALFYVLRDPVERLDWRQTYASDSRQPYGTAVLHGLLERHFGAVEHVTKDLATGLVVDTLRPAAYLFVGPGLYLDTSDLSRLVEFVDRGGVALISSKTLPDDLMHLVYQGECDDVFWEDYVHVLDTVAALTLTGDSLSVPYKFYINNRARPYEWSYVEKYLFCDYPYSIQVLGRSDEHVNFFGLRYGAGTFFFHSTPLAFTNYHLRDSLGLAYVNRLIDYLPAEAPLYIDETSGVRESIARSRNNETPRLDAESPLRYILSQPALAWGWYLLLGLGLLYLLFRARRRQRAIPILERNENTSLAFIESIGRLTFARGNHKQLAEQKMNTFLADVREQYRLPARQLDPAFEQQLAQRAEVPTDLVHRLVQLYRNIQSSSYISDKTLEDFHRLLQAFYNLRNA